MTRTFVTNSPEETESLAWALSKLLRPGALVLLKGDLGTGKTVFVKGMVRSLCGKGVKSPSFTLINEYEGPISVAHADFYRLDEADFRDMGLEDYRDDGWIIVIEWPQRLRMTPNGNGFALSIKLMEEGEEDQGRRNFRVFTVRGLTEEDEKGLSSQAFDKWEIRHE